MFHSTPKGRGSRKDHTWIFPTSTEDNTICPKDLPITTITHSKREDFPNSPSRGSVPPPGLRRGMGRQNWRSEAVSHTPDDLTYPSGSPTASRTAMEEPRRIRTRTRTMASHWILPVLLGVCWMYLASPASGFDIGRWDAGYSST